MMNKDDVKLYLTNDDGLKILKVIDSLNPIDLPVNKLCTIKQVADATGISLREAWKLIDQACDCGLVTSYGGLLSRKRVDLTEFGETLCDCDTPEHIREVLNAL